MSVPGDLPPYVHKHLYCTSTACAQQFGAEIPNLSKNFTIHWKSSIYRTNYVISFEAEDPTKTFINEKLKTLFSCCNYSEGIMEGARIHILESLTFFILWSYISSFHLTFFTLHFIPYLLPQWLALPVLVVELSWHCMLQGEGIVKASWNIQRSSDAYVREALHLRWGEGLVHFSKTEMRREVPGICEHFQ